MRLGSSRPSDGSVEGYSKLLNMVVLKPVFHLHINEGKGWLQVRALDTSIQVIDMSGSGAQGELWWVLHSSIFFNLFILIGGNYYTLELLLSTSAIITGMLFK